MIVITGAALVRPEARERALALGIDHSTRSRAEPGCVAHNCHVDAENPLRIVFVEQWRDMAAVTAHFAVPESGAFVRELTALASEPPTMALFDAEPIDRR